MKRIPFFVLVFLCVWTACFADTLSGDGFRIKHTMPDGWLNSAEYPMSELEEQLGVEEGTLKVISELPGSTKLFYSTDGTYSLDKAVRITISPMESYHKNYSGYDATQLGNIAASFMRDGKMDDYQIVKSAGGLTFLQLHHTDGLYAYTFATNENGAILRADIPASADMAQVMQWMDGISISVQRNLLLDLVIQYWYYAFAFAIVIVSIIMKNKKAASNQ